MATIDSTGKPCLSIIIPTRNAANTLQRCLNSILGQSYVNWELWIIDSMSTDKTVQLARQAAEKNARIRVLSEADSGIYEAMNKGISLARGEWIYFLGSDDELFNDVVLSEMFAMENENCDFLYGNVLLVPGGTQYDGAFDLIKLLTKNISHQAIFYRRELFDRLGAFDLRFPVYADWAFNIKCMLDQGTRLRYVERTVARFQLGGTCSDGLVLDPGWHDVRVDIFVSKFNLNNTDRDILRSLVESLIFQTELAEDSAPWKGRYKNLLHVHNDLVNSSGFRLFRSLTWPVRALLLMLRKTGKCIRWQ